MTTDDRDERDGMDPQADAALWTLLGRQEPPHKVNPYFARRVLREIALAGATRRPGWRGQIGRLLPSSVFSRQTAAWSGVLSGACAVGLFCLTHGVEARKFGSSTATPKPEIAAATTPPEAAAANPAGAASPAVDDGSVPVQEVEVIADLDNILQREESRLWTDDSSAARF